MKKKDPDCDAVFDAASNNFHHFLREAEVGYSIQIGVENALKAALAGVDLQAAISDGVMRALNGTPHFSPPTGVLTGPAPATDQPAPPVQRQEPSPLAGKPYRVTKATVTGDKEVYLNVYLKSEDETSAYFRFYRNSTEAAKWDSCLAAFVQALGITFVGDSEEMIGRQIRLYGNDLFNATSVDRIMKAMGKQL